jgi:uncharacterized OB-fold protein
MNLLEKGWECPKCGAVMSPTKSVCINCTGFVDVTIATQYTPATDSKDYPPYLDHPKGFNFQKIKGD